MKSFESEFKNGDFVVRKGMIFLIKKIMIFRDGRDCTIYYHFYLTPNKSNRLFKDDEKSFFDFGSYKIKHAEAYDKQKIIERIKSEHPNFDFNTLSFNEIKNNKPLLQNKGTGKTSRFIRDRKSVV